MFLGVDRFLPARIPTGVPVAARGGQKSQHAAPRGLQNKTTGPLNDFLRRNLASSVSKASTPTTPTVPLAGISVSGLAPFVYNGGAPPQAQTISVSSSAGAISFGTTVTGGWLSVSPGAGTTPATLSVSANPSGLANGTYGGSISVFGVSTATTPAGTSASLVVNLSSQQVLTLSTSSLPPALAGVLYSATLGVTGGKPPYQWTGSGALPGGMSLTSGGVLSVDTVGRGFVQLQRKRARQLQAALDGVGKPHANRHATGNAAFGVGSAVELFLCARRYEFAVFAELWSLEQPERHRGHADREHQRRRSLVDRVYRSSDRRATRRARSRCPCSPPRWGERTLTPARSTSARPKRVLLTRPCM